MRACEVAQEASRLLQVVFYGVRKCGQIDLKAVETLVRGSKHRAGAAILQRLRLAPSAQGSPPRCASGHLSRHHDRRTRQLLNAPGPVEFERDLRLCPPCHRGQSPRDRGLDVEGARFSPGVRRMMAAVGSESSFEQGREELELLAGWEVAAKAAERQAEAIGAGIERDPQQQITAPGDSTCPRSALPPRRSSASRWTARACQ